MFVVSSSWLCFLGGLGVYEVLEGARHVVLSLFVVICLLFNFACHVSRLTYCVLVFGGPVHLASRSEVRVQLQSLFDLIWFSLVYRGRGVPCKFGTKVWWADHF